MITGPSKTNALQTPLARLLIAWVWIILNVVLLVRVAHVSFDYGIQLRRWTWDQTEGAHLQHTLDNAIKWGHNANKFGMLQVYEKLVAEDGAEGQQGTFPGTADMRGTMPLDYPPLRLYIMSRWEKWTQKEYPTDDSGRANRPAWRRPYEFTRPMLEANAWCELAAAAVMFVLVYYWLRKCKNLPPLPWVDPVRGAWPAMFAALLVWFNPASIFNSNGYVQWDVWMLAPFLLAIFFALIDQWILAGICIGVTAMCKGQVLLVLPAIAVWQMCSLRPKWGIPMALGASAVLMLWTAYFQVIPLQWIYCVSTVVLTPLLFCLLQPWTWKRLLIGIGALLGYIAVLIFCWRSMHAEKPLYFVTAVLLSAWLVAMHHKASLIRFGAGLMLAVGCIASPWMVSNQPAFSWVITVVIALHLLVLLCFNRQHTLRNCLLHGFVVLICLELVIWPWLQSVVPDDFWPSNWAKAPEYFWFATLATVGFAAAARFLRPRFAPTWICAGVAAALFACVPLFHTSMDWYTVGIKASTDQHPMLQWCYPTNLGAILDQQYHWEFRDQINLAEYLPFLNDFLKTHPGFWLTDLIKLNANDPPTANPWQLPVRYLMIAGYVFCAALSGVGMAIQHRRRSPYFFFAMVAPWVLMFALLPQMQARYLMWAAVFSAATAAFSVEGFLLCVLLCIISVMDTALFMFHMDEATARNRPPSLFTQTWEPLLWPIFPGLSWGILLLAAIWLYLAIKPRTRPSAPGRVAPVAGL